MHALHTWPGSGSTPGATIPQAPRQPSGGQSGSGSRQRGATQWVVKGRLETRLQC